MATVIKMPQLGESVAEGTIGRWLKQPGDRVERDEPLVEIQTDKVNAEVPSPVAGFLQQILLPEGTTAAVKTDMAVIGDEPISPSGMGNSGESGSSVGTVSTGEPVGSGGMGSSGVTSGSGVTGGPGAPGGSVGSGASGGTSDFGASSGSGATSRTGGFGGSGDSGATGGSVGTSGSGGTSGSVGTGGSGLTGGSGVMGGSGGPGGAEPGSEAEPSAQGPEGTTAQRTPAGAAASQPAPLTFSYDKNLSGGVVGQRDGEAVTAANSAPASGPSTAPPAPEPPTGGKRFYTPVVLRMAEEHNIDLATIPGSGTLGRVTRKDVERAIAAGAGSPGSATIPAPASSVSAVPVAPAPEARPAPAQGEPVEPGASRAPATAPEDRPLSPMRRAIADHMARARADIPDAWSLVEIDVTRLVRYRASVLPDFQSREGFELTYLPFFIKAVLAGLRAVPELNATWRGDHIRVHHQFHLGIAVSLENGLIVPVLRDAEQLSIAGVARAVRAIVQKARGGKLILDDLQGATFTVNNPGSLGSIMSQPIVPIGQAGIVTMESIVKRPIVTPDDAIAVRSMMNSCLSFDHRILDGAQALQFLRTIKQQLETVDYPIY